MKTFLNVLYRRILYKIPLKLLLVLLAVFGLLFACFSNADYLDGLQFKSNVVWDSESVYVSLLSDLGYSNSVGGLVCFEINNFGGTNKLQILYVNNQNIRYSTEGSYHQNLFGCFGFSEGEANNYRIYIQSQYGSAVSFDINFYYLPVVNIVSGNPGYTSLQCQTEYNLIPISSVNEDYCTTNNLCPSCPTCPIGGSGFSNVYINDILHVGAPNIIMNISEEIDWDYAYTQGGQNMNIDVVGYNVDYEKVQSVIDLQNYKPTDEDFSEIISVLAPYSKIIIFFVVLFSLWAMIKKPFKSKKL